MSSDQHVQSINTLHANTSCEVPIIKMASSDGQQSQKCDEMHETWSKCHDKQKVRHEHGMELCSVISWSYRNIWITVVALQGCQVPLTLQQIFGRCKGTRCQIWFFQLLIYRFLPMMSSSITSQLPWKWWGSPLETCPLPSKKDEKTHATTVEWMVKWWQKLLYKHQTLKYVNIRVIDGR